MTKKDGFKIVIVCVVVWIVAVFYDTNNVLLKNETLLRNKPMEGERDVTLILNAEGLLEDYSYEFELKEQSYTQQEASVFFQEAKEEIDQAFKTAVTDIPAKERYVEGKVEAKWSFSPRGVINANYEVNQEEISQEGTIIHATVTLQCGKYEEIYMFAFLIEKEKLTQQERLLASLETWFEEQMEKEGISEVVLPKEIDGISLQWSQKESNISTKVLLLEIVIVFLLYLRQKEQKREMEKQHLDKMEREYPEIVGSLSVLLGAGMTLKQAWNTMANQYKRNGKEQNGESKTAWEEVLLLNRKMQEGESEKEALLQMMERIPLMCYHRLIRMLLTNKGNGTSGLCELLDKEAESAYEQQILYVRKLGEEASTKLLMPMMIMLFLIMAIVLLPAFINFSV